MIKSVIFDIDGVLLDSFRANFAFYTALLKQAGYPAASEEEFKKVMHFTLKGTLKGLTDATDEEVERMYQIGTDTFKKIYPYHLLTMPSKADEVIEALHTKYMLGIVTSCIKESIHTTPQLSALEKYFKVTVGFQDTKNHKPHPEPLLFALDKLQTDSEEAVYVGDAESDLIAGKEAGMKVILYNETNFVNAELYTNSFEALPQIIANL